MMKRATIYILICFKVILQKTKNNFKKSLKNLLITNNNFDITKIKQLKIKKGILFDDLNSS